MKSMLPFCLLCLITVSSFAQNQKKIQKSWIKTSIENLSDKPREDVRYMRYNFGKNKVSASLDPACNTYSLDYSVNENTVQIGYALYVIEELTDTSLTIMQEGFSRIKFLSEDYLTNKENVLVQAGEINGKSFYKATDTITARYEKSAPLREALSKNTEGYNVKNECYFLMTFVITEEGKIENVKVEKSIAEGFDAEVIKNLMKTSKDWKPAYYKGKPIATQMHYDVKFLKSISPFSFGTAH
jgi:hypothetical protein